MEVITKRTQFHVKGREDSVESGPLPALFVVVEERNEVLHHS